MKGLILVQILFLVPRNILCDSDHHGEAHSRTNLFNHGNNNDGGSSSGGVSSGYGVPSGGVSSGYGAPSGGYGAPSGGGGGGVSSGYGAPSGGGGVSSGYGAPSGGGVSSGYGAPAGGGGGYDSGAPVYVYQGGNGATDNGGGAGGLLAALLPIGAIALLGGLGLFTFGALFPTVTVTGRSVDRIFSKKNFFIVKILICRKKRSALNSTLPEQQLLLLQNYVETFSEMPDHVLQQDMVAKYLECGVGEYDTPSLHGCLQKLSCIVNNDSVEITDNERSVGEM